MIESIGILGTTFFALILTALGIKAAASHHPASPAPVLVEANKSRGRYGHLNRKIR